MEKNQYYLNKMGSMKKYLNMINVKQKTLSLSLIVSISILVFNACHNNEDRIDPIKPSTFSGIVTYNGIPIQSAEVAICTLPPLYSVVQRSFTDKDGKYEMVAQMEGYTIEGITGRFYDMYVKCVIKTTDGKTQSFFSLFGFSLVTGQHHTVNIPLEKW